MFSKFMKIMLLKQSRFLPALLDEDLETLFKMRPSCCQSLVVQPPLQACLIPLHFKFLVMQTIHAFEPPPTATVFINTCNDDNDNLFLRNRSGTALGHSGLFSAAPFLIIPHISDYSFYEQHCSFFWWLWPLFFASETFTWYHHCSQHWSGYGQPEDLVK